MAGINTERLVLEQRLVVASLFGIEVPNPGDWLFEAEEKIREGRLFETKPFYLPRRQLAKGLSFPGLKSPLDPWLYNQISAKRIDVDADWLPGEWILFDVTRRPEYNKGKQMYPDTDRFREILAGLRDKGGNDGILVPSNYRHVSKDSRFALSPDEIDGSKAVVVKAVVEILGLQVEQISTPSYAAFNYIGNLAHPEFGEVNTSEWLRNKFGRGDRLCSGVSAIGGLSNVDDWRSDDRFDSIGFRFQVSPPAEAS